LYAKSQRDFGETTRHADVIRREVVGGERMDGNGRGEGHRQI
jgi:hypothetical protein